MRHSYNNLGKGSVKWLILFLFGFLFSIFFVNLCSGQLLSETAFLDETSLSAMKYLEINKNSFFIYVLKKRLADIWLIALLSVSMLGTVVACAYTIWLGFTAGFLLAALTIRFGMKGTALFLISLFPHYLLYIPADVLLITCAYRLCVKLYFPEKDKIGDIDSKRKLFFQFFIQLAIIHGVAITGCVLESYVNPDMITKFLNIF